MVQFENILTASHDSGPNFQVRAYSLIYVCSIPSRVQIPAGYCLIPAKFALHYRSDVFQWGSVRSELAFLGNSAKNHAKSTRQSLSDTELFFRQILCLTAAVTRYSNVAP